MKRILTIFGPAIAIIGVAALVAATPVSESGTDNPNLSVALMFEHEGCKVYRFTDAGEYVYYSNCQGSTTAFHTESCGKNCSEKVAKQVTTRVEE